MGAGASAESKDIAGTLASQMWNILTYSDRYSIPNLNRKEIFQDFSGYPGVYSGHIWLSLVICEFKSVGFDTSIIPGFYMWP